MRVRDHVALSTAGAALLRPWLGRDVLSAWAGGVLIDVDHYVWFCVRERGLSPVAAVRLFNTAQGPRHAATRALHSQSVLLVLLLVGIRRRRVLPVAVGMALHVALDQLHERRMHHSRTAALRRDDFSCQACGTRGVHVGAHIHKQPPLLPSYETDNLISLCAPCHEAAHRAASRSGSWS
jgi:hypothetical protein